MVYGGAADSAEAFTARATLTLALVPYSQIDLDSVIGCIAHSKDIYIAWRPGAPWQVQHALVFGDGRARHPPTPPTAVGVTRVRRAGLHEGWGLGVLGG